jgi:hypothetical protein
MIKSFIHGSASRAGPEQKIKFTVHAAADSCSVHDEQQNLLSNQPFFNQITICPS